MAVLLFRIKDQFYDYKVVLSNDKQYKIVEYGLLTGRSRAFHISRKLVDEILATSLMGQLQATQKVYHKARIRKAGKKLFPAGGNIEELVSAQ